MEHLGTSAVINVSEGNRRLIGVTRGTNKSDLDKLESQLYKLHRGPLNALRCQQKCAHGPKFAKNSSESTKQDPTRVLVRRVQALCSTQFMLTYGDFLLSASFHEQLQNGFASARQR
jgi:hypothetical protein